jgi:hypothetical protein
MDKVINVRRFESQERSGFLNIKRFLHGFSHGFISLMVLIAFTCNGIYEKDKVCFVFSYTDSIRILYGLPLFLFCIGKISFYSA